MLTDSDKKLLAKFTDVHSQFLASVDDTIREANDVAALIQAGLKGNVPSQMTAIELWRRSSVDVRTKLLPDLLRCSPSIGRAVISEILTLPKEWLVQNIEQATNPLLEGADHIDYGFFLALFDQINHDLAKRLAQHALSSSDADVRELVNDYLARVGN